MRFRHSLNSLPLPRPERGGSITELRRHINVASELDFAVLVAWLIYALIGESGYPIAAITGDHGAAKTTTARMMKRLIDPHRALDAAAPRNDDDLWARARGHLVLSYDNVSQLSQEQSDLLCRVSTGYAMERRKLYSNNDVVANVVCKPQIANGIVDFVTRPDLLDRSLLIRLARIADEDRKPEAKIWREFDADHPRLFGALLDAAVLGLQRCETIDCDATVAPCGFPSDRGRRRTRICATGPISNALSASTSKWRRTWR